MNSFKNILTCEKLVKTSLSDRCGGACTLSIKKTQFQQSTFKMFLSHQMTILSIYLVIKCY